MSTIAIAILVLFCWEAPAYIMDFVATLGAGCLGRLVWYWWDLALPRLCGVCGGVPSATAELGTKGTQGANNAQLVHFDAFSPLRPLLSSLSRISLPRPTKRNTAAR